MSAECDLDVIAAFELRLLCTSGFSFNISCTSLISKALVAQTSRIKDNVSVRIRISVV